MISAGGEDGSRSIRISRPSYTLSSFNEKYEHHSDPRFSPLKTVRRCVSSYCSPRCVKNSLIRFFPFISTMRNYNWKRNFIRDLIAGATVSAMHIPQGMAYGQLASLKPVHGLYVSFFPVLLYFFFGTSRQLSIGSFAVISLMVAKVLDGEIAKGIYASHFSNFTNNVTTATINSSLDFGSGISALNESQQHAAFLDQQEMALRIDLAVSLNLITGVLQILLGLVGAGFITQYLSDPFISGYTTGCACQVFTSQLKYVFGVKIVRHTGAFKIYQTWRDVILNIAETNFVTLGLSAAAAVFLIICKFVIDPRLKKVSPMPIPAELIIMIVADLVSYFAKLGPDYGVKVVGPIPTNFPEPRMPTYFSTQLVFDSIPLVLVSFSLCISMGKLFAKQYKYKIYPNQEFFAVGISNAVSSFFDCYTASASMSRSLVQANVGGQTQLASVISCVVILSVILFLGTLLQPLPTCILAVVVMVNLRGMFLQAFDLKKFWRHCRLDAVTWMVAFAATVLIDVDIGLYIGVGFVFFTVIFQTARIHASVLRQAGTTEIFAHIKSYSNLTSTHPAVIVKWSSPIYFATVDKFISTIAKVASIPLQDADLSPLTETERIVSENVSEKATGEMDSVNRVVFGADEDPLDAVVITANQVNEKHELQSETASSSATPRRVHNMPVASPSALHNSNNITTLILDLSGVIFMDTVGLEGIKQLAQDLASNGVDLILACCSESVIQILSSDESLHDFCSMNIYVSPIDALAAVRRRETLYQFNVKENNTKALSPPSRSPGRLNLMDSQASLIQAQLEEDEAGESLQNIGSH